MIRLFTLLLYHFIPHRDLLRVYFLVHNIHLFHFRIWFCIWRVLLCKLYFLLLQSGRATPLLLTPEWFRHIFYDCYWYIQADKLYLCCKTPKDYISTIADCWYTTKFCIYLWLYISSDSYQDFVIITNTLLIINTTYTCQHRICDC